MNSCKKSLYVFAVLATTLTTSTYAFQAKETAQYFNGPTVSSVTSSGAHVSLSEKVLADLTPEEKASIYFEYYETHRMCIAIYPTPAACLPKKTKVGDLSPVLSNLKKNTSYTALYKRDNTIRCITAPCPENGFESLSIEFVTKEDTASGVSIPRNLGFRSYGENVRVLQAFLNAQGYLTVSPTGYFGIMTLRAVKDYQKASGISPTGYVGVLTRKALASSPVAVQSAGEYFEGTVTDFSTNCFVDAICSVSVDGKVVVVTVGRRQGDVGSLKGVESISDVEKKIGSRAKVYALKTEDGYTLYGNTAYYIEIQ